MRRKHKFDGRLSILYMEGSPFLQVGDVNLEGEIYDWLLEKGLIEEKPTEYLVTGLDITVEIEVTDGA